MHHVLGKKMCIHEFNECQSRTLDVSSYVFLQLVPESSHCMAWWSSILGVTSCRWLRSCVIIRGNTELLWKNRLFLRIKKHSLWKAHVVVVFFWHSKKLVFSLEIFLSCVLHCNDFHLTLLPPFCSTYNWVNANWQNEMWAYKIIRVHRSTHLNFERELKHPKTKSKKIPALIQWHSASQCLLSSIPIVAIQVFTVFWVPKFSFHNPPLGHCFKTPAASKALGFEVPNSKVMVQYFGMPTLALSRILL